METMRDVATRQRLLREAAHQFARLGYDAASLRKIAEFFGPGVKNLDMSARATIANMSASELAPLNNSLGRHIRNWFGLDAENHTLLWSCAKEAGKTALTEKEASAIIISCLALELEKTHKLRVL